MSRFLFYTAFFLFSHVVYSQENTYLKKENSITNPKIKAFNHAKNLLENDEIDAAQIWLNKAKAIHFNKNQDSIDYYINILQSELFYYMEMFQFGTSEAEKSLEIAHQLKDSLLISEAYFFKGINQFELGNLRNSESNLILSLHHFPTNKTKNRMTFTIEDEHIYNNLAQVKLKLKQLDSALYYNQLAYKKALSKKSKRGIPNAEQTFGQIYLAKNKLDSSRFYFQKSLISARNSTYTDIELVNLGFMMEIEKNNPTLRNQYLENAKTLIIENPVNSFFQRMFYELALKSLEGSGNEAEIIYIQNRLIEIQNQRKSKNNDQIQSITSQYLKSEKQLLYAENEKLKKQRNITILLIITALLCIGLLVLVLILIRRKSKREKRENKIRFESIIEGQENERNRIARELHDGLNADLSAIKYRLSDLENLKNEAEEKLKIKNLEKMIDQTCAQVRRISHDLMPASLEEYGLINSLDQYCQKLNLAEKIDIDFQFFGNYQPFGKHHEITLYRVLQELLTNSVKHSKASQILVQLNFHEEVISITVEDNGIGFDLNQKFNGIGLINVKSRIKMLKGDLEIESSSAGSGFYILIYLKNLQND